MDAGTDLTGKQFNDLYVIHRTTWAFNGGGKWMCRCVCGADREALGSVLLSGKLKSCGCRRARSARERHLTHGLSGTAEHKVWMSMKQRCTNPGHKSYKDYGGRGIKICKRWERFEMFIKDMGSRPTSKHTIERKNNEGNYTPSNCCWALHTRQNTNRRNTRLLTVDGITKPLTVWAKELGIKSKTLRARIDDHGWSVERALST